MNKEINKRSPISDPLNTDPQVDSRLKNSTLRKRYTQNWISHSHVNNRRKTNSPGDVLAAES